MSVDEAKQLKRGDTLITNKRHLGKNEIGASLEDEQIWLFMSLSLDPDGDNHMMRCKCRDAHNWKQAFFVRQMERVELK
jgi:hypothetical protein